MDGETRNKLVQFLSGEGAHMTFEEALADFPMSDINTFPPNATYSFWHLIEHMRLTQQDILHYISSEDYQEPEWPDNYWPDKSKKVDEGGWNETTSDFLSDRKKLEDIVRSKEVDLFSHVPTSEGHTIFREILLVGDHNAYHTGELGILRQVVGNWAIV